MHPILRYFPLAPIFLLVGCATHNVLENPIYFANNGDLLEFSERGPGLGSCGFVSDGYWDSAKIKLIGTKAEYTTGEFTVDYKSSSSKANKSEGTIKVDREKKKINVSIKVQGSPFPFNGNYRY